MRIYLMGFMGSGKTRTGKALAEEIGFEFLDLDAEIEKRMGMSIPEIFHKKGEGFFRKTETEILRQTVTLFHTIISTGGGTPCHSSNLEWINENGISIYLKASEQILFSRLKGQQVHRPLLAGLSDKQLRSFIRDRLKERSLFYEKAHLIHIQSSSKDDPVRELADSMDRIIGH